MGSAEYRLGRQNGGVVVVVGWYKSAFCFHLPLIVGQRHLCKESCPFTTSYSRGVKGASDYRTFTRSILQQKETSITKTEMGINVCSV